jgi:hypothetical protein
VEKRYRRPWVFQRVIIEEWVYNFGPQSLLYYLRFDNGVVERIRTGGYGY